MDVNTLRTMLKCYPPDAKITFVPVDDLGKAYCGSFQYIPDSNELLIEVPKGERK